MLSESKHPGCFLLSEGEGTVSRDTVTVTVPAATTLDPGAVLGQISATGKYVEYDDSNSDGSEDAKGVLYAALVNDTNAPVDMTGVIINFAAEVRSAALAWSDGVDEDKGTADLAALGVKARD